jgi:polyisoprenoid-binding protein YceI
MKKLLLSALFFISLVSFGQTAVGINTKTSKLDWKGSKIIGSHNGNVNFSSGKLFIKNGVLTGGEFVIDMNSITCTDITDAGTNAKLIGHLKNDDFFATDKHPTASVKITKVEKLKSKKGTYNIKADLTIKGITNSVSFPATLTKSGNKYVAKANMNIDRTKWDVKYGSASFFESLGDKAIKNEIEFGISLESL